MTFLDRLNSPKFDFTQNQSDGKIIKYQQSQALTSHFESFWSIVHSFVVSYVIRANMYPILNDFLPKIHAFVPKNIDHYILFLCNQVNLPFFQTHSCGFTK